MNRRELAETVAKKAGRFLLKHFKKDAFLTAKRGVAKEIVTEYDKRSDKLIVKEIRRHYPEDTITSEEGGTIEGLTAYRWLVDSLDGSGNFASGNPFFAVSVGLMKGRKLKCGVIFAPFLRELFIAVRNKGAFLNGKRIKVSSVRELRDAYLLSCEGGEKDNKRIARINSCLHPKVKDLRKLGSAALEAAWVATGRADAYFTTSIHAWDVAAGVLLVREAKGRVSDFHGRTWQARQNDVLFSNGKLHNTIIAQLEDR
jgi:myo-inositol-1(or 4)-monophosphatase